MGMGMNRFSLSSGSEEFCDRLEPFLLRLLGKRKILPVGL
jgi:hypothetical protein